MKQVAIFGAMPHTDAMVVLTTVASDEEAVKFIRALLDRRLIACGTLFPGARSLYRWQGKVADEHEVVLMLKTRSARLDSLAHRVYRASSVQGSGAACASGRSRPGQIP